MKNKIARPVNRRARSYDSQLLRIRTENRRVGGLKTLLVAFIIALQLALIISLYIWLGMVFKWYLVASFVLSILTCIYVLSSRRNGLSKCVWIMFILLGFTFAYVLYFLSDERIFFYRPKKRYMRVFKSAEKYVAEYREPKASKKVISDCKYLYNAGKFTAYTNTDVRYFSAGAQLFDDIIERLKSAEKFIFLEYFIISDGVLLNRIFDVLKERAACGVDVRIIYDDMGSHRTLSHKMKKKMRDAGIKLRPFNRLLARFSVAMNYRDHRKIVVVDGKTAYSGGSNLADEYINEKRMHGYWKDTGVRLDGEGVDSFTLIFLRQWEFITDVTEDYSPFFGHFERHENDAVVVPYADGLDFVYPVGKNVYENIISGANEKLWIMTPYFIPDDTVTSLIVNRAAAGVDVRIVLPDVPDNKFVYAVSRNNAEKLLAAGVKVYCMKNAFVHSKLCLSENCCVIGSINMDLRSFYQQFECAVYLSDGGVMTDAAADFEETFLNCERITLDTQKRNNVLFRIFAGVMQIFAPLM